MPIPDPITLPEWPDARAKACVLVALELADPTHENSHSTLCYIDRQEFTNMTFEELSQLYLRPMYEYTRSKLEGYARIGMITK
jgi:hypothetical protein